MKIAVIVPCRNELSNIEECIKAIYSSDLPSQCELKVVIVDGKSDDGTYELIKLLKTQFSSLSLVINEKQLTPFAFNLGIYSIDADYYQIIGARQIVDINYIREAVLTLKKDPSIWCVGGNVQNVFLNECGKIIAAAMSTSFGMGLGNFRTLESSGYVDTVGTPMYPAWVFDRIGYFDEELIRNQDDDFNYRITKAGGKIFFNAYVHLKYYVRGNYKNLWKQFYQYGYWKVFVNRKHKAVTTFRQLIPPLFVLFLLILPFTYFMGNLIFFLSISIFAIYIVMLAYFSVSLKLRQADLSLRGLLKSFLILHVSYGLGYLSGILEFVILGKNPSQKHKQLSR